MEGDGEQITPTWSINSRAGGQQPVSQCICVQYKHLRKLNSNLKMILETSAKTNTDPKNDGFHNRNLPFLGGYLGAVFQKSSFPLSILQIQVVNFVSHHLTGNYSRGPF